MKKGISLLLACCCVLSCACGSNSSVVSTQESKIDESTQSESTIETENEITTESETVSMEEKKAEYNFGDDVMINTESGSYVIKIVGIQNVDWQVDSEGMRVVTIQTEVENIDYSGLYDNSLSAYEIGSDKVKLLDDEGFELKFYDIVGPEDGQYIVGAHIDIGSKRKVSLPYLVPSESDTFRIKVDDLLSGIISVEPNDITEFPTYSSVNEDATEFGFTIAEYEQCLKSLIDSNSDLDVTRQISNNTTVLSISMSNGDISADHARIAFSGISGGIVDENMTGLNGMMGVVIGNSNYAGLIISAMISASDQSLSSDDVKAVAYELLDNEPNNLVKNRISYSLMMSDNEVYISIVPENSSNRETN